MNFSSLQRLSAAGIVATALLGNASPGRAANTWDATAGTNWWFDPTNWSRDSANDIANGGPFLPPGQLDGSNVLVATDTQINSGWNTAGEGVVFDPTADPNFASALTRPFPAGFGVTQPAGTPQHVIRELYISRNTTNANLLTIKSGILSSSANVIIGRSTNVVGAIAEGKVVQTGGVFRVNNNSLDLSNREINSTTTNNTWGNGTYDYRGGTLEVSLIGGSGLRLAAGGSAGAGGHGRFIMHNPASGGYVRAYELLVAAHGGPSGGDPVRDPDGITTGVGSVEFHFENGGVRPMQLLKNLTINNGLDADGFGTRSARLDLVLNAPPTLTAGVPQNLGLFDVDFDQNDANTGIIDGSGSLGDFFSSADDPNILLNQNATVSGIFGNTKYNWTISYTGNITWGDADNSVIAAGGIVGTGGTDVVLIGLSSETVAVDDADFDNDSDVDGNDFLIWQRGVGVGTTNAAGDANGNSVVDGADLAVWKTQFGPGAPAAGAIGAVPEPAGGVLFMLAALAMGGAYRCRLGRSPT
jgi:hypothetical protein